MAVPDEAEFHSNVADRPTGHDRAAATQRRLAEAVREKAAALLSSAYRDELTGALLRRPGRQQLERAIRRARKGSTPLYILFLDVDGLKAVNDRDGHSRGDQVLASTGTALRMSLRSDDVIVRYGGDEFVCALTATTPTDATAAIDRVQRTLRQRAPHVAVSAGYARLEASDSLDEVIERADADLYARRRRRRTDDRSANREHTRREPTSNAAGATITCGACASQIDLGDFALVSRYRMTRRAECPACGEATLILLGAHSRCDAVDLDVVDPCPPADHLNARGSSP